MPIEIDLIDGARHTYRVEGGLLTLTASRVALVRGLDDGSPDQSATALLRARQLVQAAHPLGAQYDASLPPGVGIVVGYQSLGTDADNAARVLVEYDTPRLGGGGGDGGGGTPLMVEDETSIVENTTQLSPKDWTPLQVTFTDPDDANNNITDTATVSYPSTLRTLVLSGIVPAADMDPYRDAVNTVNDGAWKGKAKGFWRFSRFRDQTAIGSDFFHVAAELQTRVSRHWAEVSVLRDTQTGKFVPVRANVMQGLRNAAYAYGIISTVNGAVLVGPYDLSNFTTLFGA